MTRRSRKNIADPNELEVLRHVDPKSHQHVWDKGLLEINGVHVRPTEEKLREALELTRRDETKAFDRYFTDLANSRTDGAQKFEQIVEDANRGEFWERLGFRLSAAYHDVLAADSAIESGAMAWAEKLIGRAERLYGSWALLGIKDPLNLEDAINRLKERVSGMKKGQD
ncbi:MAG: hypothetical protein M1569_00965 [Candidatus Marsarchaeota archaeon]|nr:hypothetical protein [Candidatus Marsarchaeota archaeon]MCL5412958.1 hypothetical protein [Candidatus Marsarchaeota archaeon]